MIKNGRVACEDGGHTDGITYSRAPEQRWFLVRWVGKWVTGSSTPQHEVCCDRHGPIYVELKDAEAGVQLGGVPLLGHPEYLTAVARQAEELAKLPRLVCLRGVDASSDGRVLVDGSLVRPGRYRLDCLDGLPRVLTTSRPHF